MVFDKILRRYIEIGGVEPLVVDKIFRRFIGIVSVKPLVVHILMSFGVRGEVLWVKVSYIEADTA